MNNFYEQRDSVIFNCRITTISAKALSDVAALYGINEHQIVRGHANELARICENQNEIVNEQQLTIVSEINRLALSSIEHLTTLIKSQRSQVVERPSSGRLH